MPVTIAQLPPLDAVLVSHDHYDHLVLRRASASWRSCGVPFVTSLGVGAHLEAWGVAPERITELDWWEQHALPGGSCAFTAAPVAALLRARRSDDRNRRCGRRG